LPRRPEPLDEVPADRTHVDLLGDRDTDEAPTVPIRVDGGDDKRFIDLGELGQGGMGEVRRVRDRVLERVVALKCVKSEYGDKALVIARFVDEAHATAQLQHPGVVPVYELGQLADGRPFFTMKEIQGRTFGELVDDVHDPDPALRSADASLRAPLAGSAPTSPWNLRRLVELLARVGETMAYAHSRGVVHRDLKPDNVMAGAWGEVLVLDWGLARVDSHHVDSVITTSDIGRTRFGQVMGTPAYMAPEQARGDVDAMGPHSDVYALGTLLYEALAGRPPYEGPGGDLVVAQVVAGPPPPLPPSVPEPLRAVCAHAMSREPADRPDAAGFVAGLQAWLDGAQTRERAMAMILRADGMLDGILSRRKEAATLRQEAAAILAPLRPNAKLALKRPGWQREDRARELEHEADLHEIEYTQTLRAALLQVADLREAHQRLAAYWRARHAEAEAAGSPTAPLLLALLGSHVSSPSDEAYIRGDGALTVVTEPAGAEVVLHAFATRERRLVAEHVGTLGTTPLHAVRLPMGSFLVEIRGEGRVPVWYPVRIRRQQHWTGLGPRQVSPRPVWLPERGQLGPGDVYVPVGPAWCGGPHGIEPWAGANVWVEGFVIRRFPVTNREYRAFLDDLVAHGREDDALRYVPRERAGSSDQGAMVYGRDAKRRFILVADADGDLWQDEWPVTLVSFAAAEAYAAWEAARTGLPWRLPTEAEREKAARGVDARLYPWGDVFDPTWTCAADSHDGPPCLVSVHAFPKDESPYGARGMAGNVLDWCLPVPGFGPPHQREGTVVIRGGAFHGGAMSATCSSRHTVDPGMRMSALGFRLARSLP
jgi:formylglycine-generating enzyme required for sulfatase activity/tRNA A-37 threonylcarbamoyl transferase component Bud32